MNRLELDSRALARRQVKRPAKKGKLSGKTIKRAVSIVSKLRGER